MNTIKPQLEKVSIDTFKIPVKTTEKFKKQVKYLCSKIPNNEWSGVLFYTPNGSISNIENFSVTLEEILPLNKGSETYTEYEFGENYVDYMMQNEYLEELKMGQIHSHQNMNVFFSSTDIGELNDNAPSHNYYLSIIVNNRMEICGKLCFVIKSEDKHEFEFKAKDENNKLFTYEKKFYSINKDKLVIYDCDIDFTFEEIKVDEYFSNQVNKIIKDYEDNKVNRFNFHEPYNYSLKSNINNTNLGWKNPKFKNSITNYKPNVKKVNSNNKYSSFNNSHNTNINNQYDIRDFAMFVLNTGNDISEFKSIEDILRKYRAFNISQKTLATTISNKYDSSFEKYFEKDINKKPLFYENILIELIDYLELVSEVDLDSNLSQYLRPTIDKLIGIEALYSNIENNEIDF